MFVESRTEPEPICLRVIVDSTECLGEDDEVDIDVFDHKERANAGNYLTRGDRPQRLKLKCQIEGCDAECTAIHFGDGTILYEDNDEYMTPEPVPEEICFKLQQNKLTVKHLGKFGLVRYQK